MKAVVIGHVFERSFGRTEYFADRRARTARAAFVYEGDKSLFRHCRRFSSPAITSDDPNEYLLLLKLMYVEYNARIDDQVAPGVHEYLESVEWSRGGPGEIDAIRIELAPMTGALEYPQSGEPVDRAAQMSAAREQGVDARTVANDEKAMLCLILCSLWTNFVAWVCCSPVESRDGTK